jgi:hypothetical protein
MSRTVYVEAEVELREIDKHDLACELVERLGKEGALNFVAAVKVEEGRRSAFHPSDGKDPEKELRLTVRDALEYLDEGKSDVAMHMLRMIAAPETRLTDWWAIKDGKHPFLSLPKQADQ